MSRKPTSEDTQPIVAEKKPRKSRTQNPLTVNLTWRVYAYEFAGIVIFTIYHDKELQEVVAMNTDGTLRELLPHQVTELKTVISKAFRTKSESLTLLGTLAARPISLAVFDIMYKSLEIAREFERIESMKDNPYQQHTDEQKAE